MCWTPIVQPGRQIYSLGAMPDVIALTDSEKRFFISSDDKLIWTPRAIALFAHMEEGALDKSCGSFSFFNRL